MFPLTQWSCSGPLFQILMGNVPLHVNATENNIECLVSGDLQVNYNNIHKVYSKPLLPLLLCRKCYSKLPYLFEKWLKVFWEPFIEPWQFEVNVIRKQEMSLSSSNLTDIHLKSSGHLNVNFTESLIEVRTSLNPLECLVL